MPNLSRWMKYAKARLDAAIGQGHRDLDELEAQREVELADKPWLRSESDAPTFDEARARIEWQAAQAGKALEGGGGTASGPGPESAPDAAGAVPSPPAPSVSGSGADGRAAAEVATARLEMEARERASAARLNAIRDELGIEPPAGE